MNGKFNGNNKIHDIQTSLIKKGYIILNKISETLQGCVYFGKILNSNKKIAIKIASMNIYQNEFSMTGQNRINENIIKEVKIVKYLQDKNPPKGFLRYIDDFNDGKYYYFIMDYGGESLWEYIMKNIKLIKQNKLDINKWKIHVQKLFKQMCLYVNWLHNNGVCHLDISLENCLIKNNIIYFCDFGLSEYFKNNNYKCSKFCGKVMYQCPEIYHKSKCFDASKADLWSLGVTLFVMHTGLPIYKVPSINDPYFCNAVNGFIKKMLIAWKMDHFMSSNVYDLLNSIIKPEKHRYNMKQIIYHPYLKNIEPY